MQNEILFFFSAVGVFNTLCISGYLFFKNRRLNPHLFLALFLLWISVRVGISCFYFFMGTIHPLVIQMGLIANLLAGVSLYIFVSSAKELPPSALLHFAAIIFMVILFSGFVPFTDFFQFWDHTVRYVIHSIVALYMVLSWVQLYKLYKTTHAVYTKFIILSAFTLVCMSFSISLFTSYIVGPIGASIIFYMTIFIFFLDFKKKKRSPKKINTATATPIITAIRQYILDNQIYKKQHIKIKELAEQLDMPTHTLSQIINDHLQLSFTSFINQFRIEEAKKLLITEKNLTIEAIGKEAGFGSKTTFFKVFKQEVGITPREFIKSTPDLENGTNLASEILDAKNI